MPKQQNFAFEYGQWTTHEGVRRMIISWNPTQTMVHLYMGHESVWVPVEDITDTSDFMDTDAERKAKGYAF